MAATLVIAAATGVGSVAAAATPPPGRPGVVIYVSPSGNDHNPGNRPQRPVATLARAQQLVRRALASTARHRPVTVLVGGGTYYLSSPLSFTDADSGTQSAPVTWEAAPHAQVTISGGRQLRPQWSPSAPGSKIMEATVPAGLNFDGLFVNGKRQILARYPNYNPSASRLSGSTTLADLNAESAKWADPSTALVRAMHCGDWGSVSFTVSGRTNNALDLHYVGDSNRGQDCGLTVGNGPGSVGPVMVENVREELDSPGEWFYDKTDGQLLYYPPAGVSLATAVVQTAEQDQLITINGASSAHPAHDITFSGFHFTQTHRTLFDSTYQPLGKGDWAVVRKGAVYMKNAERITVANSFFDQLGGNGVFMDGFNSHNVIRGNRFESDGASDVQIAGNPDAVRDYSDNYYDEVPIDDTAPGPKSDNYPRDILVTGNVMENMGQFELQSSGVNIAMSEDITVDGNTIDGSPRACLNIEDGLWGGDVISNNDLFNCVQQTGDNGSINTWGRGRFWASSGNNTLAPGTTFEGSTGTKLTDAQAKDMMKLDVIAPITIEHNRFWHDGDWALDLDDGSSNYIIKDNLILKGGIKLRDGFDRTVENNVILSGSIFEQVSHGDDGDVIQHNITLGGLPYNNTLNNPVTAGYQIGQNLFWNGGIPISVNPDGRGNVRLSSDGATIDPTSPWVQDGMDVNSAVGNPQFTAADPTETYDFTVAPTSPAIALGYQNFPMTGFGAPGGPLPPQAVISYTDAGTSGGTSATMTTQPEMLLGATASNVPSAAVQSSLGLTQPVGLYLSVVPASSLAGQAGLQAGDDILQVNGAAVTTDRNTFWSMYNQVAAGGTITLAVRRGQSDVTITLAKPTQPETLNDTSGVVYTGPGWSWKNSSTGGSGSYLNDLWATTNHGDTWSLTFNGTGIDIISETNTDEGDVALTLDGQPYKTVSFVTPTRVYQSKVVSITGLSPGVHTITGTMETGSYMIVDGFTVYHS